MVLSSLQYLVTVVFLSHTLLRVLRSHWLFGPHHPSSQPLLHVTAPSVSWISWHMNKKSLTKLFLEGSWLGQCGYLSIRISVQWLVCVVCVSFCIQNASQPLGASTLCSLWPFLDHVYPSAGVQGVPAARIGRSRPYLLGTGAVAKLYPVICSVSQHTDPDSGLTSFHTVWFSSVWHLLETT